MSADAEHLLAQLHQLVAELDGLAKGGATAAEKGGSGIAAQIKGALTGAREALQDVEDGLEHDLKTHAVTIDRYLRDNAWLSIGVAAAVGFLLGAMLRQRD